jgi:hypothetical protein
MDLLWQALIVALFLGAGLFGLALERRLTRRNRRR